MKHFILTTLLLFSLLQGYSQALYPYVKAGKWGFCDDKKTVIIQPVYDFAKPFKHGLAFVQKGKLWGAVNPAGKLVIAAKYQDLRFGYNAFVLADSIKYSIVDGNLKAARVALFDSTGKRIYKARFNELPAPFGWDDEDLYPKSGSFSFTENTKYGTMDHKYKITAAATITDQYAPTYSQGLIVVKVGEKYGYKDKKGVMVVPAKYDAAKSFDKYGNAQVELDGKVGVINTRGGVVIELKYKSINEYSGFYTVEIGSKIGLYNRAGKEIIPCCNLGYPVFSFYPDNNYLVCRQDEKTKKYGFMDTTGTFVIAPQFDNAQSFVNNKAWVKSGDKEFFINTKGERVTPEYEKVDMNCMFNGSVILFARGDGWGVADYDGKELFYMRGHRVKSFCGDYDFFSVEKDGLYGVVNRNGEWVVQPQFTEELDIVDGLVYFNRSERTGPENMYGEKTWVRVESYYILPNGTILRD
jgi:hypothetical protein